MKAVFLGDRAQIGQVYPDTIIKQLQVLVELYDLPLERGDMERHREALAEADVLFSTWGMLPLTEEEIADYLPKLQRVFYGAGSVQYFARPFLRRGIGVSSAWAANAVPVIEYATSLILLSLRGFFPAMGLATGGQWRAGAERASRCPGAYGSRVGILGAGMIGSGVIRELKRHDLEVWVYDPYLSAEKAAALGAVKQEDLGYLFANCHVISNHIANLPATREMLTYAHFSRMQPYATFINSGRNRQIREADFLRALEEEPTRLAILDVTDPQEPPQPDHPYLHRENILLTPHIAGTLSGEKARMAQYMVDELKRMQAGEPLLWDVTEKMLETMA